MHFKKITNCLRFEKNKFFTFLNLNFLKKYNFQMIHFLEFSLKSHFLSIKSQYETYLITFKKK
jgi:hypothetical protein